MVWGAGDADGDGDDKLVEPAGGDGALGGVESRERSAFYDGVGKGQGRSMGAFEGDVRGEEEKEAWGASARRQGA